MAVTKKIEKNPALGDVEAYLSKGGQVQADMESKDNGYHWKTICLRMPNDMLKKVDRKVKRRAALTRTAWILEAIQQKLAAEGEYEQASEERE